MSQFHSPPSAYSDSLRQQASLSPPPLCFPQYNEALAREFDTILRAQIPSPLIEALPAFLNWVDGLLITHREKALPVSEIGLKRLELFYPAHFLAEARVIPVGACPALPLDSLGVSGIAMPDGDQARGITFRNCFFVQEGALSDETLHTHELVHAAQWKILGDTAFTLLYAYGLIQHGYRESPLEEMAYGIDRRFSRGDAPFDVVDEVEKGLRGLLSRITS